MTKNPIYNALAAVAYIVCIVFIMNWASNNFFMENSLLMPVMMLSLFTLSAAVMGYVFCYQPLRLYLDGKKDEAVKLFLRTIAVFAIIPFGIFIVYFLITKT